MSVHPWPRALQRTATQRPVPQPQAMPLLSARVERVEADSCELEAPAPDRRARIAAGCLLRPEPGDTVLLLVPPSGPCFVLCVLERADDRGCLRLPGGAELRGEPQALSVHAARLRFVGDEALSLRSAGVDVQAGSCRMSSSVLQLRAGRVQALLGSLHARGREYLTRVGRSLAEFGDSVRRVRGMDEIHVTQQRLRVERRLHIQSRDTSILAQNHVRVDARQIDLG